MQMPYSEAVLRDRQRREFAHGVRAGMRRFHTFDDKVFPEELHVFFALEMMRRQHGGKYRHAGFELNLHESADHRLSDELMPVNATVDNEACRDDACIASTLRKPFCVQRDFECAGYFEEIDVVGAIAALLHGFEKRVLALVDDIAMPARLNERDARTVGRGRMAGCF